jgi:membrane protein
MADLPDLILHRIPHHMRDTAIRGFQIGRRVVVGVYTDGFIHAGNLAYLALVTLFPFFIVAAAIASALGQTEESRQAVNAMIRAMPPGVGGVLEGPIYDVLEARTGNLLWLGAFVGLWTSGSFIETIRDILRRAYHDRSDAPFWSYRLGSIGLTIASVLLMMMAFALQIFAVGVEEAISRFWPVATQHVHNLIATTKIVPAVILYGTIWMLFYTLTPRPYRVALYPKWPGALATTLWWVGVTALLPWMLGLTGGYDKTYGSLAGVMVALIFFYLAGFGLVIGAELNAALAISIRSGLKDGSEWGNSIKEEACPD